MVEAGSTTGKTGHSTTALLGVYLNDHLAAMSGVLELFRRTISAHQGSPTGDVLTQLVADIGTDRIALLDMMSTLGVPVRRYKIGAAWLAEKAGRLKLNGSVLRRSPLSNLVELEGLRLGVEANALAWRTLRGLAAHVDRLDEARLDELIARSGRYAGTLEELRAATVPTAFGLE